MWNSECGINAGTQGFSLTLQEIFPEGLTQENRGKTHGRNSECGIRSEESTDRPDKKIIGKKMKIEIGFS